MDEGLAVHADHFREGGRERCRPNYQDSPIPALHSRRTPEKWEARVRLVSARQRMALTLLPARATDANKQEHPDADEAVDHTARVDQKSVLCIIAYQ